MVESIQALQPVSTWINILGNVQSQKGIDQFAALPHLQEVLEQRQYTAHIF